MVAQCASLARKHARLSEEVTQRLAQLTALGLGPLDAAHLALAEAAACDALVTCDGRFEKGAVRIASSVRVVNPLQLLSEQSHE